MTTTSDFVADGTARILIDIDPQTSPAEWVKSIFANADDRTAGLIAKHFVAALLQERFPYLDLRDVSRQTRQVESESSSALSIGSLIYHTSIKPTAAVIRACRQSIAAEHLPILLVPDSQFDRAAILAKQSRIESLICLFSIENYATMAIILMSGDRSVGPIEVFRDVLHRYNQRQTAEVETDLSLQIEVR
ncbi:MAG: DUF4928 family protein [Chloroflexi bacterium]|nr:DUF4928 family protein [Chloroflexota bacterium]